MTTASMLREWIDAVAAPLIAEDQNEGYKKGDVVVVINNTNAKGHQGTVIRVGKTDGMVSDGYLAVELDDGRKIAVTPAEVMRTDELGKLPDDTGGHGMYELKLTFEKDGKKETEVEYVPRPFGSAVLYSQSVGRMARDSETTKQRIADGWRLVGQSARAVHR